ncbi:PREDICTED: tRNA pseudouridine(38/39) synthase-like [Priapulus caudatus]|uniref:tRNA pseudouridine(38/39) synthase-like n=1 Tax=Priapulus caudatus TaxID=37621 RepID=A0ABM1ERB4_PRICU|nr:PREDICTED: tRNA pseudouridine(38/39) synthase-like [Priapulus caudatus]
MGKKDNQMDVDLDSLSKTELISQVKRLEMHVKQLQAIIAKANSTGLDHKRPSKKKKKPFDFSKYNKRHVALKIAYLGWDCRGYAVQDDTSNTIEAVLFDCLLKTRLIESRETSNYHRCGRTDKGVSALGQVVSIDLRSTAASGVGVTTRDGAVADVKPEIPYVRILNRVLPAHVRVLAWSPVEQGFSARFDCDERVYRYYFPAGDLDIAAMRAAAARLIGEHDFRNLCKMDVSNGVVNYRRNISRASLSPVSGVADDDDDDDLSPVAADDGYGMWRLTIAGRAFLWHQVRCVVAVLLLVGERQEAPAVVSRLLDVSRCPRKPQYGMAADYPLALHDCSHAAVRWRYDAAEHAAVRRHLQEAWTRHSVRATMLREMLRYLDEREVEGGGGRGEEVVGGGDERESEEGRGGEVEGGGDKRKVEGGRDERGVEGGGDRERAVARVVRHQSRCLVQGNRSRVHKPLLQRQMCESLEDRIDHYVKRRKIERPLDPGESQVEGLVTCEPQVEGMVTCEPQVEGMVTCDANSHDGDPSTK